MYKLIVKHKGRLLKEVILDPTRLYTAGRRDGCEIILSEESGISREHFNLKFENGFWQVVLVSRYGSLQYKGESVKNIDLHPEDVFQAPPYEFILHVTNEEEFVGGNSDNRGGDPADSNYLPDSIGGPVRTQSMDKTVVRHIEYLPFIRMIDESTGEHHLIQLGAGNCWIAGRDSHSSIQIQDNRVSRRQFEIHSVDGRYQIIDLGSVNGTILNGNSLNPNELTSLNSGDLISVLNNRMYFELHDSDFKNKINAAVSLPAVSSPVYIPQVHIQNSLETKLTQADTQLVLSERSGAIVEPPSLYNEAPGIEHEPEAEQDNFVDPTPPPQALDKRFLILVSILIVAILYIFSDSRGSKKSGPNNVNPNSGPTGQLSPAQRAKLQQTYNLANNLFIQGKYQMSMTELDKVADLSKDLPEFQELRQLVSEALVLNEQLHRKELEDANRKAIEEKVRTLVGRCRRLKVPTVSTSKMEECLSEARSLSPEDDEIQSLLQYASSMEESREAKEEQKAEYAALVARFKNLYEQAEKVERSNNTLAAIEAYEKVLASNLPDPSNLKAAAKTKIANLKGGIEQKISNTLNLANKQHSNHEIRKAIQTLRTLSSIAPDNEQIQDRITKYMGDLKKEMMLIYQEAVLEESFGNVDGNENRPGAKEKWRKIIETDVPDGEYYRKAKMKLKKYGAF